MENSKYFEMIQTYLNNVFASLPHTQETLNMKNDMYCSMVDKFNALIQDGAGGDEAFGKVVGEFGSLGEIRSALGINMQTGVDGADAVISPKRKKEYDTFKIKQGTLIATGVVLCMAAVFGYEWYEYLLRTESLANMAFGLLVAAGVFLFVFAGTDEARFFDITSPIKRPYPISAERFKSYQRFLGIRSWLMSFAISLFVFAPFSSDIYGTIPIPFMVSIGVAILIIIGTVHETYKDVSGRK